MIFRTLEIYDLNDCNENNIKEEQPECFICFETRINNEELPIKFKKQTYFYKFCECDCFVHINCIDNWYNFNNSCPICHNILIKIYNVEYIYYYCKNNIKISSIFHIIYYFKYFLIQFFIFTITIFHIFRIVNRVTERFLIEEDDYGIYEICDF